MGNRSTKQARTPQKTKLSPTDNGSDSPSLATTIKRLSLKVLGYGDSTVEPTPRVGNIFGAPLRSAVVKSPDYREDHEDFHVRFIPLVVRQCCAFLNAKGINEEGLYRIPGNKATIRELQDRFDSLENVSLLEETTKRYIEPADIAGLILHYFKSLPEPIFTEELSAKYTNIKFKDLTREQKIPILVEFITQLPAMNRETLRLFMYHLILVSKNHKKNQMTMKNLLVCIYGMSPFSPVVYNLLDNFEILFPADQSVEWTLEICKAQVASLQEKVANDTVPHLIGSPSSPTVESMMGEPASPFVPDASPAATMITVSNIEEIEQKAPETVLIQEQPVSVISEIAEEPVVEEAPAAAPAAPQEEAQPTPVEEPVQPAETKTEEVTQATIPACEEPVQELKTEEPVQTSAAEEVPQEATQNVAQEEPVAEVVSETTPTETVQEEVPQAPSAEVVVTQEETPEVVAPIQEETPQASTGAAEVQTESHSEPQASSRPEYDPLPADENIPEATESNTASVSQDTAVSESALEVEAA